MDYSGNLIFTAASFTKTSLELTEHVVGFGNIVETVSKSEHLRSGPQINENLHIRYERFLYTLLVSFITRVNLIRRFSGPHSLVDTKTTGFES